MSKRDYVAKHVSSIPPSGIRRFFDIASEMKDAISLGVGEPDFVTPWNIREAGIYSQERGHTHYTSNSGIKELRVNISRYLKDRFDQDYDWDNIIITVGASESIDIALRAVLDPNDEVLVPEPSYVSYAPSVTLAGGKSVPVILTAENAFKLTEQQMLSVITPKTKALILPYPNNPTGAIMTHAELEGVARVAKAHDLIVITDEIYAELTYGGARHQSIATLPGMAERTVVLNGFSKAFAMTGWRLGYATGPVEIVRAMLKIHQYVIMCAPTFSQYAALEALESGFKDNFAAVAVMAEEYDRRRKYLLKAFNDMGLDCFEAKGAFYLFPCIKKTGLTSEDFAQKLLMEHKVATVPGTAFGDSGEGFIRCSYASSMENIVEAARRIKAFVG